MQGSVALPGIIFSLVIGYLADRLGRKRVVVASTLIFSTFGLAGFWASSFWMLVGFRFLQGIGISGMLGLGIALVGDLFEGPERTRAVGYNLAGIQFMSMLGPIISGLIATGGTFRPFLLFGLGFPLALWATRLAIPRHAVTTRSPLRHVRDMVADMRASNTMTDYLGVLTASLLAVVVFHGVILTATPLFLESEFGVAVQGRGAILAFFQGGVVIAALVFSRVGSRLGSRAVTLGFFLMALGLALISTTSSVAQTALRSGGHRIRVRYVHVRWVRCSPPAPPRRPTGDWPFRCWWPPYGSPRQSAPRPRPWRPIVSLHARPSSAPLCW